MGSGATITATRSDGTMWAWGRGNYGASGLGNTTSYSSPVQIGALTVWNNSTFTGTAANARKHVITSIGTLWAWGQNTSGVLGDGSTTNRSSPVQIGALTSWSKGSTNASGTIMVKTDGTLWGWGNQQNNGTGVLYSSPVQVGALTTWSNVFGGSQYASFGVKGA